MAIILDFPRECLPRSASDDPRPAASLPQSLISETRRSVERSLVLLDIAVVRLRTSVPEQMAGKFDREIFAIEALLAAARLEARKI